MLGYKLFDAKDYSWWESFNTAFSWKLSIKSWLWWQGDLSQKKVYKIFKRSYGIFKLGVEKPEKSF